ncbi:MAG: hypothetical protein IJO33_01305 [Bacilli bacterium]|nr:hypothetical protein [Bacilli bacterium]
MNLVLDFLVNNYIWFLVITLILIFALIGYLADIKKDERFSKKIEIENEIESRLNVAAVANITLNQMVQQQSDKLNANLNNVVSGNSDVKLEQSISSEPVSGVNISDSTVDGNLLNSDDVSQNTSVSTSSNNGI